MTAFFQSFNDKRVKTEKFIGSHVGYVLKTLSASEEDSPVFGERFTSLQNGFERTAGIITGSLFCLLEIPLCLLSIIISAIDGLWELAKGNSSIARMQVKNIHDELIDIRFVALLAVASLFVNLADVGVGIVTTLSDATTTAPSM